MRLVLPVAVLLALAPIAGAQQPGSFSLPMGTTAAREPILTIDSDELYQQSAWGRRVAAEIEAEGNKIAEENARLEAQFSTEEQELTELRATLPADEFRSRANEFDARAQTVRRERAQALVVLQDKTANEHAAFLQAVLPIMSTLMEERGALVILEQRGVFISANRIDVTEELLARIDAQIGAGPAQGAN